jgi:hypothetical protein
VAHDTGENVFNSDFEKLEESAQKWLEAAGGLISEVVNVSQCECTNPKTDQRGVLLTILYRAKKNAVTA